MFKLNLCTGCTCLAVWKILMAPSSSAVKLIKLNTASFAIANDESLVKLNKAISISSSDKIAVFPSGEPVRPIRNK